MIQRIQSLYLLLTTFLSVLFLSGSFLNFSNGNGIEVTMNFNGILESSVAGNSQMIRSLVPLTVTMLIICILSFAAIFLFKKRKIQLKLTVSVIILTILFIGLMLFYVYWTAGKYQLKPVMGFNTFIPLLILVFAILAYRGIMRDENLVRSYDRLR
jgi:hypothetical protein